MNSEASFRDTPPTPPRPAAPMITCERGSPWRSQIRRGDGLSWGLTCARQFSNTEFMPAASGLNARMVSSPSTNAAAAAGRMNRQADTPAARMAISSLRRFRVTKAASTPNRKTKGSSCRITVGDFRIVRPSSVRKPTSVLAPRLRERSTKLISITTEASRAAVAAIPARVWPRT